MNSYRTIAWAAVPVALIVLLSAAPFGTAARGAAPTSTTLLAPGESQWAYGATLNTTTTWTNATGGYSASLTAFYGWQTVLTQTNGSAGEIQLQIQRTSAVDYWLTFCKPGCSTPTWTGSLTFLAWESETGFANLTTNGSVNVNGTSVPALALQNESNQVHGNITETVTAGYHGLLKVHTAQYYFSVNASSELGISFSPALGLVPDTLTPGLSWNSSAAFAAAGGWSARYDYLHVPMSGAATQFSGPLSGTVSASGDVALQGADVGAVSLHDGHSTTAIALALIGPFHLHEGILLLPAQSDVLGAGANAWALYQNDSAVAATASADFAAHQPHLGLLASSTSYAPQPTSQSSLVDAGAMPASTGAAPMAGETPQTSPPSGSAVVQGQPEAVPTAQAGTACLVAGSCVAPPGGSTPTARSGVIGLLVVGLLVGSVIGLAVVVTRRRTVPPPSHPNARLYPPVQLPGAAPSPPTPGSESPDGVPADDPLSHLW